MKERSYWEEVKMAKGKEGIISGFTGMNTGKIENCYSRMQIKAKQNASGFCGVNNGEINSSFCENKMSSKKNIISFCKNTKGITDCFSILDEKANAETVLDKSYAIKKENFSNKAAKSGSWNKKEIWKEQNGVPELVARQYKETMDKESVLHIHNEKEFIDFVTGVNQGLDEYAFANVVLENDLDFKGKRIAPIGKSELSPFCGLFNGNGHQIRNVVIKEKKQEVTGLFGYLKNAIVENLRVDCVVHGGKYTGALVGINEDSKILGCHVVAKCDGLYCVGGFVGKNNGIIEGCSCNGQLKKPANKAIVAGAGSVASAAVVAGVAAYLLMGGNDGAVRYPAIPVSEEAVPIKGDKDEPETKGHSILYAINTEINAKTGTKPAQIKFKNPGKSNHNIVVELQITDKELKKKIGKTGRSKEELEQKDYDAKTSRYTIAKTGAIPPGYEQKTVDLTTLEDGTVLPKGTYQAVAYLNMYDIKTNEKAMVNAQTPVTLVIGG